MYTPIVSPTILSKLVNLIVEEGARKATKIISKNQTIKATRKLFNGKIDKRDKRVEILLTIGTPNYEERIFIKQAEKANEPFPIKKILLKWPKK